MLDLAEDVIRVLDSFGIDSVHEVDADSRVVDLRDPIGNIGLTREFELLMALFRSLLDSAAHLPDSAPGHGGLERLANYVER